jgi:5-methylcytosine-specific restriction endonuclease McrA
MNCLNCGKETKNPKFCSRSCSAKISNRFRTVSEESKLKRSIALTGRIGWSRWIKVPLEVVQKRKNSYTKEKRLLANIKSSNTLKSRWVDITVPFIESDAIFASKCTLRKYLIWKDARCRKCNISNWQEEPITFEIHHLDGNTKNNRLSNTTLLCPNCHSQTHNYRNRKRLAGMAKQENALALKASGETLAGSCPATSTN